MIYKCDHCYLELEKLPDIAFCPECDSPNIKEILDRDVIDNSPPNKAERIYAYISGSYFLLISIFIFLSSWVSSSFFIFLLGFLFFVPGIYRVNPKSLIHRRKTPLRLPGPITLPKPPWKFRAIILLALTLFIIAPYFWNAPVDKAYFLIILWLIFLT
tara:strand:- start:2590 stop:3063 length:474 start_codon:yes stop_codon:yes gene_type:complete